MNIKMLKAALAGLILSVSGFANAGLITNDLLASGDGLITLDTSTSFEWLDVDQNDGSFTQAINDWGQYGFRIANQTEVLTLLNTIGMPNLAHSSQSWSSPTGYLDAVAAFAQLGNDSCTTCLNFSYNYSSTDTYAFNNAQLRAALSYYNTHTLGHGTVQAPTSYYHALLVRDAVDVPEPSTLAIFALGIMGLASRRLKKQ